MAKKAKKLKLPQKLVGSTLAYYIKSPKYNAELGIYSDNKAVLLTNTSEAADESSPDEVYTMSSGGKGVKVDNPELFADTMRLAFELRDQNAELISKEAAIEAADRMGIPNKLRWRRPAWFSDKDDGAVICWTWTNVFKKKEEPGKSELTLIMANDTANVLRVLVKQPPLPSWIKIAASTQEENALYLLELIAKGEKRLTFDIETYDPRGSGKEFKYGLNPWDGRIRMLQIYAPGKNMCAIIDFGPRHMSLDYPQAVIDKIQQIVIGRTIQFHNCLFDMGFMSLQWDILWFWTRIEDTMVMSQNHWAGVKFLPHGLGALSERCGFGSMDKGLQKSDFGLPLCMQQYIYGAEDTRVTYKVGERLKSFLNEKGKRTNKKAVDTDQRFAVVANMIRTRGVPINFETTKKVRQATYEYMEPKARAWEEATGLPRNVHWTKLTPWLEERGHNVLVYDRATRKEKKSSNKAVLKEAVKTDPVIQHLLDYRVAHTRLQYIDGMLNCNRDGRVFCGLRILATQGMGRTSSGQIIKKEYQTLNIQNPANKNREYKELPDIRPCFEAGEDYVFIVIDLSSAHLRLAGKFSGAIEYLAKFAPGEDVHCFNASIVIAACKPGTPLSDYKVYLPCKKHAPNDEKHPYDAYEDICKILGKRISRKTFNELVSDAGFYRKVSKVAIYTKINFGGPTVFKTQLKKMTGIDLDLETCEIVMQALGEGLPEVDIWVRQQLKACNDNSGYKNFNYGKAVYTVDEDDEEEEDTSNLVDYGQIVSPSGRMRYVPRYERISKKGNKWTSAKINDVSAHMWQSPEADVEKLTQIRFLSEYIVPNKLWNKVWIPNFVHDEVQAIAHVSVAREAAETYGRINREEWAKVCPGIEGVEGSPDSWIGKNWADVH